MNVHSASLHHYIAAPYRVQQLLARVNPFWVFKKVPKKPIFRWSEGYVVARALYSEGALTAAKWLSNKKAGLYSMRDLLNFK